MKTKILCSIFFFCALFSSVFANVEYVVLQVKTLDDKACMENLTKNLKNIPAVVNAKASETPNEVHLAWSSRQSFQPWIFYDVVRKSGYQLECINVTLSGNVIEMRDGYLLKYAENSIPAVLYLPEHSPVTCELDASPNTTFYITGKLARCASRHKYFVVKVDALKKCR